MSVIQSKQNELRYMQRQSLEEEARLYQNMYRDIIHNYGIDCRYYKMKIPYPEMFKQTVDTNNIILHAYGVDISPDYSISSDILAYMDVESDAFQLNKFGLEPNMDVNFIFDITEFATKFAWKLGKIKEFQIYEKEISREVIKLDTDTVSSFGNLEIMDFFESEILSGKVLIDIPEGQIGTSYTVPIKRYQHSGGGYSFPVNPDIAKSFYYNVDIKEYLDIYSFFEYKVEDIITNKDKDGNKIWKRILHGRLYGTILFRDISMTSRYMDTIHPDIGDIITIDFPDERSREQYEITDCQDKNLGPDGLNPLLHKYIWKCHVRRYINSGEMNPEENEANDRQQKTLDMVQDSEERILDQISKYDEESNDAVYGGYERDVNKSVKDVHDEPQFIDDGSYIDVKKFQNGAKLVTDGYELYFIDSKNIQTQLTITRVDDNLPGIPQSKMNTIFATNDQFLFRNIEGEICVIFQDDDMTTGQYQMCLNAILDSRSIHAEGNSDGIVFAFPNCDTVLISADDKLFGRLGNKSKKMVRLV